jgi:glycosyltransferase involved in cell wall biosynthesis
LLPSYSPKQSLAALLAAKSLGIRTVMMNDSHAGTARARGVSAMVKRQLVGLFDAALVAGQPQKRYFATLGIPEEKIFVGYDAVDNNYFARRAEEIRSNGSENRILYQLPEHYFLSLGRFVEKKNLSMLIRAFRRFLDRCKTKQTHLVLVGSGEEEEKLKALCRTFGLPVYEKSAFGVEGIQITNQKSQIKNEKPGVHFYGFRQIEENPIFYALADAFILPSLWEEWGLVVNEAMASGLPVVVSETAGCAEDLLQSVQSTQLCSTEVQSQLKEFRLGQQIRENGFVFDPKSSDELSRVLQFFECCCETRRAMSQASRRIVEKFSCENFAKNALLAAEAALGLRSSSAAESGREVAVARVQ